MKTIHVDVGFIPPTADILRYRNDVGFGRNENSQMFHKDVTRPGAWRTRIPLVILHNLNRDADGRSIRKHSGRETLKRHCKAVFDLRLNDYKLSCIQGEGDVAMKAAVATENGLEIRDIPQPKLKPFEVLVKVKAAGLNRADLAAAQGRGGHGAVGATIGLDWAGEVVEVGAEAEGGFSPGDRVMCAGAGGYAEYAVCDWGRTVSIPDDMTFEHAATLPVALGTMHDALVSNGRLKAGESVLIQGASSGVGLMALQIAKLLGAKLVIGTSTNADRRARLKDFGADLAIDTKDPSWPDLVLSATDGQGVNLIIDQVSGNLVNGSMRAAAILGRIVNVGRLGGAKAEFDFDLHATRRITYIGVTHRTRSADELREETRAMWADLANAVRNKKLSLPIERTYSLEQAKAAQEQMRANQHFGKILLVP